MLKQAQHHFKTSKATPTPPQANQKNIPNHIRTLQNQSNQIQTTFKQTNKQINSKRHQTNSRTKQQHIQQCSDITSKQFKATPNLLQQF